MEAGFKNSELNKDFFTAVAKGAGYSSLLSWEEFTFGEGFSFAGARAEESKKDVDETRTGFIAFNVRCLTQDGKEEAIKVAVKSKLPAEVYVGGFASLVKGTQVYEPAMEYWGIASEQDQGPTREIRIAQLAQTDAALQRIMPKVYHTVLDPANRKYVFASELVDTKTEVVRGGSLHGESWTRSQIYHVLDELVAFHVKSYAMVDVMKKDDVICEHPARHLAALPMWSSLLDELEARKSMSPAQLKLFRNNLENLPSITEDLLSYPLCWAHNDCHIGNMWLRKGPNDDKERFCLYDFETSTIHVPQRDVFMFLTWILFVTEEPGCVRQRMREYADYHREKLRGALHSHSEETAKAFNDYERYMRIFDYCAYEVFFNRLLFSPFLSEGMKKGMGLNFDKIWGSMLAYVEAI